MRFFHNLPLGRKLTLVTMAISGVALTLACGIFAVYEQTAFRRGMARDSAVIADMFGDNVASGLAFNDATAMGQTLQALNADRRVLAAGVYDKSGTLVARYQRAGLPAPFVFPAMPGTGPRFHPDRLDTFKDITLAGETIGAVYIGTDLYELHARVGRYVLIVGALLAGCLLVVLLLASRLQKIVFQPIVDLAETTAAVATGRDYSVRAVKRGDDEVGRLIDGFNDMLSEIQARDIVLESRVAERTRQLQSEVAAHSRVAETLLVSEAFLNSLVESVPMSVFRKDAQGRFIFANRRYCELHNKPLADIMGKTDFDLYPSELAEKLNEQDATTMATRETIDVVERLPRPGGGEGWLQTIKVAVVDRAGRVVGTQGITWDVTERKKAEAELANSLSVLHATLEATIDGLLVVDSRGRVTTFNRKFVEMWRIQDDVLAAGDDARALAEVASQLKDPGSFMDKVRHLYADPEAESFDVLEFEDGRIFERYSQPQRVGGVSVGRVWCFRDITERKRAEAAVAEASGLLESLMAHTHDFVYFKDRQSRFVRYSEALLRRFRLTDPDALKGKTDFDCYAESRARPAFDDEQEIMRTGQPVVGKQEQETSADGQTCWLLTTKMPWRDKAGNIIGTFGVSRDVSAIKTAETELAYERDLLRELMNSSPDQIYFKDRQSRFLKVSTAQARNFGVASPDDLVGKTDFNFFTDEHARLAFEDEQEIIRTGRPVIGKVEKETWLDGRASWALTSKMPLRNNLGETIGTVGISKDITPLKEAEAKLELLHRQLLEASRQAGMAEVATSVLHNVGNVLNSVNVSATLVADQVRQSKAGNVAKLATLLEQHAGDLAAFLTHDAKGKVIPSYLRALAGNLDAERGTMVTELNDLRKNIEHIKDIVAMQQSYAKVAGVTETVSVAELVDDALRMNAGAFARHEVIVERDFQSQPVLLLEKHKVLQILVNLMRNAKYACDDSGRSDKRMIIRVSSEGGRVKIAVIDNGVGIPAENVTRIFNHGFTTRKEGHGFGLHNGALVAKELGGSLTVTSAGPGKGAAFTLELPEQTAALVG